jgi:DNA-binding MarR family transcriptional regulator
MSSRLPKTSTRSPHESIGVLLREPFLAVTEDLHRRLTERGHAEVRPPHGMVFQFLDDEGTRVSVLAERAQITKQSMAELVAHLEEHGYVERIRDPSDGRAKLVRSTARGQEVTAIARQGLAEIESEWASRVGAEKMRRLRALLEELNRAL